MVRYHRTFRRRRPSRFRVRRPYAKRTRKTIRGRRGPFRSRGRRPTRIGGPLYRLTCFAKLRYHDEYFGLNCGGGTYTSHTFRGNGPYDPDKTGVGGQPTGFKAFAENYTYYNCFASKITIRAKQNAYDKPLNVFIIPLSKTDAAPTNASDYVQTIECPRTHHVRLPDWIEGNPVIERKLSHFATTKGVSGYPVCNKDSTCSVATTPTNYWDWLIGVGSSEGESVGGSIVLDVTIDYYVKFFTPKYIPDD